MALENQYNLSGLVVDTVRKEDGILAVSNRNDSLDKNRYGEADNWVEGGVVYAENAGSLGADDLEGISSALKY